ncbi:hypothetical protein TH63_12795 [Rufibacter radiotolerans]|uniref:Uncharacterized protein n=1 Tax=Rufibacter radiotolerans TaxID=1379910 RepID=A0A0H4W792_9BACT|nr:hypothetical protein TH63_12795 [Rufibacter radiotolerans]
MGLFFNDQKVAAFKNTEVYGRRFSAIFLKTGLKQLRPLRRIFFIAYLLVFTPSRNQSFTL